MRGGVTPFAHNSVRGHIFTTHEGAYRPLVPPVQVSVLKFCVLFSSSFAYFVLCGAVMT